MMVLEMMMRGWDIMMMMVVVIVVVAMLPGLW